MLARLVVDATTCRPQLRQLTRKQANITRITNTMDKSRADRAGKEKKTLVGRYFSLSGQQVVIKRVFIGGTNSYAKPTQVTIIASPASTSKTTTTKISQLPRVRHVSLGTRCQMSGDRGWEDDQRLKAGV